MNVSHIEKVIRNNRPNFAAYQLGKETEALLAERDALRAQVASARARIDEATDGAWNGELVEQIEGLISQRDNARAIADALANDRRCLFSLLRCPEGDFGAVESKLRAADDVRIERDALRAQVAQVREALLGIAELADRVLWGETTETELMEEVSRLEP